MVATIFQDGKDSTYVKNLYINLKIWFAIILGCKHHRPSTNSYDYVNADQKYMLFFISSRIKLNIPAIMFNYLVEILKETRDIGSKHRKWIPMGRLIYEILMERRLMESLNLPKELDI